MALTIEDWRLVNAIAGDSERYRRQARLDAYYWSQQYEHLQHEWAPGAYPPGHSKAGKAIPSRERKPKVIYPLARRAVREVVDLLFGAGRWPSAKVDGDTTTTKALGVLEAHVRLPARMRSLGRMVVTTGSAAAAVRLAPNGALAVDLLPGRHCVPTFGDDDPAAAARWGIGLDELVELRVQYARPVEETVAGRTETVWYAVRRDYTPEAVVSYEDARLGPSNAALATIPEWVESGRWLHGTGVVPAVWFRSEWVENDVDGPGLYEDCLELLDDINYTLSRLSDAVGVNLDPLKVFKNLGIEGFRAVMESLAVGGGNTLAIPPSAHDTSLELKEIVGSSLEKAALHIGEQRSRVLEVTQVVIQRQEDAGGAQSGVALDRLYRPMLALVDGLRAEVGASLTALDNRLLRVAAANRPALRRTLASALPATLATEADVVLDWPPVFDHGPEEMLASAQAYALLVSSRLLSRETAVEYVGADLQVDDIEAEKKRIAAEDEADIVPAVGPGADAPGDTAAGDEDEGPQQE